MRRRRQARRQSLRRTVELAVFVAAALPATVVLVFGVLESRAAGGDAFRAVVLTGLALVVMLAAGGFAIVVGSSITRDLQRLHGISTLLARSAQRRGAGMSVPKVSMEFVETQSVLSALTVLVSHVEMSRRHDVELASFVAHDMRTPLAALAMSLEQMQTQELGHSAWISGQRSEVARLLRDLDVLVESLRGTDTAEGRDDRSISSASVADAVRTTAARIGAATGATIEVVVHRDHYAGLDADQLVRVVENLITNAVRYGTGHVRIEVGAGSLRILNDIDVSGMRAVDVTGHSSHGLGQAIVRRWVEGLGGKLVIEATTGRYIVDVILPRPLAPK